MLMLNLLVSILSAFLGASLALVFGGSALMALGCYVLGASLGLAGSATVGLCLCLFRHDEADGRDVVGWTAALRG